MTKYGGRARSARAHSRTGGFDLRTTEGWQALEAAWREAVRAESETFSEHSRREAAALAEIKGAAKLGRRLTRSEEKAIRERCGERAADARTAEASQRVDELLAAALDHATPTLDALRVKLAMLGRRDGHSDFEAGLRRLDAGRDRIRAEQERWLRFVDDVRRCALLE